MNLGEKFLRCATKVLVALIKQVPGLGAMVDVANECVEEIDELEREQQIHSLEDRVRQLEEAGRYSPAEAARIAKETIAELERDVPAEKVQAIVEIVSVMPAQIAQKTRATLKMARLRGTAAHTALPIDPNTTKPEERRAFYSGLLPLRRPHFQTGTPVPHRPGWLFDSLLGMGGFGEVWKVGHKLLGTQQALKLCLEEKSARVLKNEAQTIATLLKSLSCDPNIVSVADANVDEEPFWIAFEYLEGGTLESYLRSFGGPMPVEEARRVFQGICGGMARAHKIGLVHRDLKPANILMAGDVPKIGDFGLGKIVAEQESKNSRSALTMRGCGTIGYMSPEQQNSLPADPSDDVYALAVLLFQMLVGSTTRTTHYFRKDLARVGAPEEIVALISECLENGRGERPANAGMLLDMALKAQNIPPKTTPPIVVEKSKSSSGYGLPSNLWIPCRYDHQGERLLDMTTDTWCNLSVEEQWKYAAAYQEGYAKDKGMKVEKTIDKAFPHTVIVKKGGWFSSDVTQEVTETARFSFRLIPPGRFWMGSPAGEKDRYDNEKRHRVVISRPFYLGTAEVTQAQWKAATGESPWSGKSYVKEHASHPAVYISWDDVKQKLLAHLGSEFAMPTEAQWEYACRAGVTRRFYWGDDNDYSEIGAYAWYDKNAWDIGEQYAHPVGQKKPNAWGLFDMSGNVWEWCLDCYGDYLSGDQIDPTGTQSESSRVSRGGCWDALEVRWLRSADRDGNQPSSAYFYLGVRLFLRP